MDTNFSWSTDKEMGDPMELYECYSNFLTSEYFVFYKNIFKILAVEDIWKLICHLRKNNE